MRFSILFMLAVIGCGGSESGGDAGTSTGDATTGGSSESSSSSSSSSESSTGPACSEDLELCDGECVDVQVDPMHCGECDNALPPDVACVDGEPGCPLQGFEVCDGACVDVLNDDENCGECGAACGDANCMGNGCCHIITSTTRPRSCADICAEAGMACECPMAASASYEGACGLGAVNTASCDDVPAAMVTCGSDEMCDCLLERIDCGCRP